MGTFDLNGKLTGTSKVDSGVGAININLIDNLENYTIDVSKGLGSVTLDGKKLEIDRIYGTGENYLSVDGGVGEIKIDSKEQWWMMYDKSNKKIRLNSKLSLW